MAHSALVSRRFGPLHRAAARTSSDTNLSRRVFSLPSETRRTFRREIPLGLATPDHTVPYGTFFRGTLSQALRARLRSVLSLRDALADISQRHLLENPDRFAIRLTEQISSIGLFAVTESQCTRGRARRRGRGRFQIFGILTEAMAFWAFRSTALAPSAKPKNRR
jgi:hypothetical protein